MANGNSALNTPVFAENMAEMVGIIDSVLIDPQFCRIAAFVLNHTSYNGVMMVLPWMGVKRLEAGRVFAWSADMVVKANELFDIRRLLRQGTIAQGTDFRTSDNRFLGQMVDFCFDDANGAITAYKVTGGPFSDVQTGEGYLPAVDAIRFDQQTNSAYLPLDFQELQRLIDKKS